MAKRTTRRASSSGSNDKTPNKAIFTTSTGVKIPLLKISPFLVDSAKSAVSMPEPPTYKTVTVAGVEEEHVYDKDTIQGDDISPEDKAAWDLYERELLIAQAQLGVSMMRVLLGEGVDIKIPDDGWVEKQEYYGIKIPQDPIARKIHYIQTEMIKTPEDLTSLILTAMAMTGVPKEEYEAARSSFRAALQEYAGGSIELEQAEPLESVGAVDSG